MWIKLSTDLNVTTFEEQTPLAIIVHQLEGKLTLRNPESIVQAPSHG